MQYNLIAVAAFATLVSAQGFGGVPACANACVQRYLPTACQLDFNCICSNQTFIADIACCVAGACDSAGQTSALGAASSICAGVNGVALPTAAGCSGSATSAYTTGSGSLASASAHSATSGSAAASSSGSSSGSITSQASSSAASATSAAASSSSSKAAGVKLAAQGLGLAGVVLGAAIML